MKHLWISVLLAALSTASAQFNCFTCTNCEYLNRDQVDRIRCGGGILPPTTTTAYTGPPTNPTTIGVTASAGSGDIIPSTAAPTPAGTPTNPPGITMTPMAQEEEAPLASTLDPIRQRRNAEMLQSNFRCFQIRVSFNNTNTIVNRGCVNFQGTNEQICAAANNGVAPLECNLCTSELCNSSKNLVASISVIFISLLILLRF